MGLGEYVQDSTSSNDNSSSSSSNSSGGGDSDEFPKYKKRCPKHLIKSGGEDGWEYLTYPDTPEITYRSDWYGVWELDDPLPSWQNWRRWWFDESEFMNVEYKVEKVHGVSLRKVLKNNPQKGHELITESVRKFEPEVDYEGYKNTRDCPLCKERVNLEEDDYIEVENKVVHSHHNMKELASAGLLD